MKIVTLTLAPAFDIHCDADSITVDHENIARITDFDAGGKGVNISRALNCFDVSNTAVVVIGCENGVDFEIPAEFKEAEENLTKIRDEAKSAVEEELKKLKFLKALRR